MRKAGIIGSVCVAIGLLSAAPAWAGTATVSPVPAAPGSGITITITCDDPANLVAFGGNATLFVGGGGFVNAPQGVKNFTIQNGVTNGNYPVVFMCTGQGEGSAPGPTVESLTALVVVASQPTATPSGAPSTGGGGSQTQGNKALGVAALLAAGALGGATLLVRRRRSA